MLKTPSQMEMLKSIILKKIAGDQRASENENSGNPFSGLDAYFQHICRCYPTLHRD